MKPLVSAAELAAMTGVVVADVRWYLDGRSGLAAYEAGHIPGAIFVDLDTVLAAPAGDGSRGRHPLPEPAAFAAALGGLGVAEDVPVVAYDDTGGATAARLWWMLRAVGQPSAVLDGGIAAWTGPLESGRGPSLPPVERAVHPWPASSIVELCATGGTQLDNERVLVVDARAPERYRGDVEPVDPKAGHIPGAINRPWSENLDPVTGRFLPPDVLREQFVDGAISYCGSGVTACHNLLAMEVAGLRGGRLYPGSWSEWSSSDRPVATGDHP